MPLASALGRVSGYTFTDVILRLICTDNAIPHVCENRQTPESAHLPCKPACQLVHSHHLFTQLARLNYSPVRNLLFKLPAERSHDLALSIIGKAPASMLRCMTGSSVKDTSVSVMGIDFPNAVGLAAGLDKNADYYHGLAHFGFGFIEVGTVTPRPQPGNDKPRMFRLQQDDAVINRMGFNNKGVDFLAKRVSQTRYNGILGINIGKNKDTPMDRAHEDYQHCMQQVYTLADYITVNISSPNTPGLRDLQVGDATKKLLTEVKSTQQTLTDKHGRYVPVAVKVAPDMAPADLDDFCDTARALRIDAIIATNTTLARPDLKSTHASESGGLSGKPVLAKSRVTISQLAQRLHNEIPIIGCGGIFSGDDALAHLEAGASLVQVYTGFIYRGPELVSEIRQSITATHSKQQ